MHRSGSREVCVMPLQQSLNYATFSHKSRETVRRVKSEMEDGGGGGCLDSPQSAHK